MRKYELAVLLHPDLEINLEATLKRLEDILKDNKAKVIKRDDWGKRKLAYIINNQNFAIYFFYQIEMPAEKVANLERALRLSDEVLRYLIVTYDPMQEENKTDEKDEEQDPQPKPSKEKEDVVK